MQYLVNPRLGPEERLEVRDRARPEGRPKRSSLGHFRRITRGYEDTVLGKSWFQLPLPTDSICARLSRALISVRLSGMVPCWCRSGSHGMPSQTTIAPTRSRSARWTSESDSKDLHSPAGPQGSRLNDGRQHKPPSGPPNSGQGRTSAFTRSRCGQTLLGLLGGGGLAAERKNPVMSVAMSLSA